MIDIIARLYLKPIYLYLITAIVGLLIYQYFKWRRVLSYWKDRSIQTPPTLPIFGTAFSFFFNTKPELEMKWYGQYGRVYGAYAGRQPFLCIAEPDMIKQVLVKQFHSFRNRRDNRIPHKIFMSNMFRTRDETWKRIRAIASPTFTTSKMRKMYPLIDQCSQDFIANLIQITKKTDGQSPVQIDLKDIMGAYTMDVIARCAFATKTDIYANPNHPLIDNAKNFFNFTLLSILLVRFAPKCLTNRVIRGPTQSIDLIVDFARNIIKQRKQNPQKTYNDFLQLLIDVEHQPVTEKVPTGAADTADTEAHHLNEGLDERVANRQAFSGVRDKKLSEDEILAQCFLFLIAGYETTTTTLVFLCYELALNPDLQDRLYDETSQVFNKSKGTVDYKAMSRLPFLDALLSETVRHYPPFIQLERQAMDSVVLTDSVGNSPDVLVDKNVIIQIPIYAIHHDPEHYANPHCFDPDRFMGSNRDTIKPYTYIPFGVGPRNCLGMRFALLEAKLVITKMIQQFKFCPVPDTDVPVQFNKGTFLLQAKRLVVGIVRR